MSLGAGAYQVGEAGQCSREQSPPGTVKYLQMYQPILTLPWVKEKGRVGKKHRRKMPSKQQGYSKKLCEELQTSNCVFK